MLRVVHLPFLFAQTVPGSYMDPTLEHDLHSQTKPWVRSDPILEYYLI